MVTEVTSVSLALFQNISWALHVSLNAQRGCSTARCLIPVKLVMQLANRAVHQTTMTVTLVKVRNYYSLIRKTDLGFFFGCKSPIRHLRAEEETGPSWFLQRLLGLLLGTGKIWPIADRRVQRSQKQLREISRFQFPSHSRSGELTYMYFEYTTSEKANHAWNRYSASSRINHVVDCLFFLTPWVILSRVFRKF